MNHNPQTEQDYAEIFSALTSSPRPYRLVEFPEPIPGTENAFIQVAIRPLTNREIKVVHLATANAVKKHVDANKLDPRDSAVEAMRYNRHLVEILFRACRNPANVERSAFKSSEELEGFSDDTLEKLFTSYQRVRNELSRQIHGMTEAEVDEVIEQIAKGGIADADSFSDRLNSVGLPRLLLRLALRLAKSKLSTSSFGSPADETLNASKNGEGETAESPETEQSNASRPEKSGS